MGLLTLGQPLAWSETERHKEDLKVQSALQFANIVKRNEDRSPDSFKYGDEVEYILVSYDKEKKRCFVLCTAEQILAGLEEQRFGNTKDSSWHPEFASYMVEGTPRCPYEGTIESLLTVEPNMKMRRDAVLGLLKEGESCLSISYPSLGVPGFTSPPMSPDASSPDAAYSLFWPAGAVFGGHPRFKNLYTNIFNRRGSKVAINIPIFKDEKTPSPFVEDFSHLGAPEDYVDAIPDHIYMDQMGFGMGLCCLQVTFQASDMEEARWLHDQLTPITPILLCLSAATPIFRGMLADRDCRYNTISACVDDRNPKERGLEPSETVPVIGKSRYGTTSLYIAESSEQFNDEAVNIHEAVFDILLKKGLDRPIARHLAHLNIRDHLQVFEERLVQDPENSTEHFESQNSANWWNMRFKPPPIDHKDIGWRVEFRPTEVQLTDFENAAFVTLIILITKAIQSKKLNFLIPISKVNENMDRAQKRDAVIEEKFFFRSNHIEATDLEGMMIKEMSIDEVVNGKDQGFQGLIPVVRQYLDESDCTGPTSSKLEEYLNLLSMRASGKLPTLARWTRDFVRSHKSYSRDSIVNDEIVYDLLQKMDSISNGAGECKELLGDLQTTTTAAASYQ